MSTEPLVSEIERAFPERPFAIELWDGSLIPSTGANGGGPTFTARSKDALAYAVAAPGQLGLGRAYVAGEIEVAPREERGLVEHLLRSGECAVLRIRPDGLVVHAGARALGRRHAFRHQDVYEHQTLGLGERQGLEQHGVDDGEDRGVGADAERERGDGDRRKSGRAA